MKNKKILFSVLCLSILITTGCIVRYYKVSDIKKNLNHGLEQTQTIIDTAKKDYLSKNNILKSLLKNTQNQKLTPYPELDNLLQELSEKLTLLKEQKTKLNNIKQQFHSLSQGLNQIRSNRPEWNQNEQIKRNFSNRLSVIKEHMKEYRETSNEFIQIANQNKISKISTKKINNSLSYYIKNTNKTVKENQKKIKEAHELIKLAKENSHNKNDLKKKEDTLIEMNYILNKINYENKKMHTIINEFKKEASTRKEFWSGPGMTSHTILEKAQNQTKIILKLGNKFSTLSKLL
jgi:chromosome segregation ATPase